MKSSYDEFNNDLESMDIEAIEHFGMSITDFIGHARQVVDTVEDVINNNIIGTIKNLPNEINDIKDKITNVATEVEHTVIDKVEGGLKDVSKGAG